MCCGSKRLDAARNAPSPYTQAAPRAHTGAAGPADLAAPAAMPGAPAGAADSAAIAAGGAVFIHDGPGELLVTGPGTGRRYRFAGRGARLAVAASDVPAVAQVQNLRRLV
ncbi:hypothetical protein GCM10027277_01120 [Pseudoduganella ginsengisoli]|uniref:Uncharacterized protein n=1 Tax=Pseudoduganella ginsengisoli TaxID=1462440 RepID=A0A6L6Q9A2_9BURK|nr:hypothetical protein [Pseudoduganella ginsengisoli]MTW06225.1 hypothetical protein [Pseudoduganella ginsengisoli]